MRVIGVAVAAGVMACGAMAVPPDPQRPLAEQSCPEALVRLAEARQGSPLIPPEERAAVLARAERDTLRLCGALPEPGATGERGAAIPEARTVTDIARFSTQMPHNLGSTSVLTSY